MGCAGGVGGVELGATLRARGQRREDRLCPLFL